MLKNEIFKTKNCATLNPFLLQFTKYFWKGKHVHRHFNSSQDTQEGDTCDIDYKKILTTQFLLVGRYCFKIERSLSIFPNFPTKPELKALTNK